MAKVRAFETYRGYNLAESKRGKRKIRVYGSLRRSFYFEADTVTEAKTWVDLQITEAKS